MNPGTQPRLPGVEATAQPGGAPTSPDGTPLDVPSGQPATMATPSVGDPRLARLSLNQRSIAQWSLTEAVEGCARAGVPGLGLWREPVADLGVDAARRLLEAADLRATSMCRGGFFTVADPQARRAAHEENVRAIEETAAVGAPTLVLVPGGLPEGDRDLSAARARCAEAIADLVPVAQEHGITLGIEPMHPIFAADRGVVSTLAQALDMAEQFPADVVGVVVDTFHLWWEPGILDQVARAGSRIVSYQVSDWITPLPPDALLSRGMMGDGHIDFARFTEAVAATGYSGDVEVEIFNADLWAADGRAALDTVIRRYTQLIAPFL